MGLGPKRFRRRKRNVEARPAHAGGTDTMQRYRVRVLEPPFLAAAWLVLLGSTALLAVYGAVVADAAWEVGVTHWVQSTSPDALHQIARFMTVIGRSPISTIIPVVAIAAMWVWGQRHLSIFLAAAALARILSVALKELVDRPRPSASVVDVTYQLGGHSFPSGHALGATLFYGFLIYCAELSISYKPVRRLVQGSLAIVIVLMGYSRVELGAHWPTDVLGGYAIGLLVLSAMVWLHRRWVNRATKSGFAPARDAELSGTS